MSVCRVCFESEELCLREFRVSESSEVVVVLGCYVAVVVVAVIGDDTPSTSCAHSRGYFGILLLLVLGFFCLFFCVLYFNQ